MKLSCSIERFVANSAWLVIEGSDIWWSEMVMERSWVGRIPHLNATNGWLISLTELLSETCR